MIRKQKLTLSGMIAFVFLPFLCVFAQDHDPKISLGKEVIIKSIVLNEDRTLMVYTPSNYNKSTGKYPVLYLLDANTNFKMTTGIISYLAAYDLIPEMIVVGIKNTDRNRDFTPSKSISSPGRYPTAGGADKFVKFIKNEVFPYIRKNYRVQPFRIISGHSLGGLFTLHTLISDPDMFNGYISLSPSLWWNDQELIPKIEQFVKKQSSLKKFLFLSIADEGGTEGYDILNNLFNNIKKNDPGEFTVKFIHYGKENHISTAIPATSHALTELFADWMLPHSALFDGIESIKKHYKDLSGKLGYKIYVPESTVNTAGRYALRAQKINEAILLFRYNVSSYPESVNAYESLAEAYDLNGEKELAVKSYRKALELDPDNINFANKLKKLEGK